MALAFALLMIFSTTMKTEFIGLHDTKHQFSEPNYTIQISEILVSASSEEYNGTDWNGDGDIGSLSDQFIELLEFRY